MPAYSAWTSPLAFPAARTGVPCDGNSYNRRFPDHDILPGKTRHYAAGGDTMNVDFFYKYPSVFRQAYIIV
jgi:hypothetical protein